MSSEQLHEAVDLRAFVRETIAQIEDGAQEAHAAVLGREREELTHIGSSRLKEVEFNVVVSARRATGGTGGVDLRVLRLGGELGGESGVEQRVSFSVPVMIRQVGHRFDYTAGKLETRPPRRPKSRFDEMFDDPRE